MRRALALVALAACRSKAPVFDQKQLNVEAQVQLNKLAKVLKAAWRTNGAFPAGKTGPVPAQPCCKNPDGRCPVTTAWHADRTWTALDFDVLDPGHFQFTYESDGKKALATAIADLDCDGAMLTYALILTVEDGVPRAVLDQPRAGTD